MTTRLRRKEAANLKGGLFPARGAPKLLEVRKSALSAAQAHKEDDHLISYFTWIKQWERHYPQLGGRLCFHTENERLLDEEKSVTRRNRKTGQEYKINLAGMHRQLKGVKRGVSDVLNLRPSRGFTYFAGELKVRRGELTDDQSEFLEQARDAGAFAHTCWCWSELARLTLYYFEIEDRGAYLATGRPEDYLIPSLGGHNRRCGCDLII